MVALPVRCFPDGAVVMADLNGFAVHASQSSFGLHAYARLSSASTTRIITIQAIILLIGAHKIDPCFLQAGQTLVLSANLDRPWMLVVGLAPP